MPDNRPPRSALLPLILTLGFLSACAADGVAGRSAQPANSGSENARLTREKDWAQATFAGGCFWCLEPPLEKLAGVHEVVSGYTGGTVANPSYEDVWKGRTEHKEAVRVLYDPQRISYKKLLAVFWQQFDPTDAGGSFVDRGEHYTSGIWYHNEEQQRLAEESKQLIARSGLFDEPIVTAIRPARDFYRAEKYHQDFYKKSTARYRSYRRGSGRDRFIARTWETRPGLFSDWLGEGTKKKNDGVVPPASR